MRNVCCKIENGFQHIHRDAVSFPVKRYLRYFLTSMQITYEVDRKTHQDIEWKREHQWNFQWLQLKQDLKDLFGVFDYDLARNLFFQRGAIARDVSSSASSAVSVTSLSWTHTTVAGSNLYMVVTMQTGANTGSNAATYNSIACTNRVSNATSQRQTILDLVNPSTGANTVACSWTTATTGICAAITYTGAAQSGQPDATGTFGEATGTSRAVSITTVADNAWAVMALTHDAAEVQTAGANTNKLQEFTDNGMTVFDGGPKTPAGSFTLNSSWATSAANRGAIMSFAPVAAAAATQPAFLINFM